MDLVDVPSRDMQGPHRYREADLWCHASTTAAVVQDWTSVTSMSRDVLFEPLQQQQEALVS